MGGEGETKRTVGIAIDFDKLLGKDDEAPPELLIIGAAKKFKPLVEMANDEEVDAETENRNRKFSDIDLQEKITRHRRLLKTLDLVDGGEKLRATLRKLEMELERRRHLKVDDKCKRVKTLADESKCKGLIFDLSLPGTPPSKRGSEYALLACSKMETDKSTKSFSEELHMLNQSDPIKTRERVPFSPQIKQNKDFSSRQAPFKHPSHLSVNMNSQKRINGEQQGHHAYNTSSHPSDKDASCCSTKRESGARSPLPFNSRRNKTKAVVLVLEDGGEVEELDADVVNKADQVEKSSKKTRIYYPSRDDPIAIQICYSDMACLAPESCLSSTIMNFYIRYLQKPTSSPSARRKHDYHIFNTYFYEKLKQDALTKTNKESSFLKFRRWWKGVDIFEKAYIFLPINENHHWSLVIICMPNKEDRSGPIENDESGPIILHLDSLGLHSSKSIFSNVRRFLREELNFLRQKALPELPIADDNWDRLFRRTDEIVIEVPQQKNAYDCGLFVLYFMERFIQQAPECLKKQDLNMFGGQWFRPEEASNLRKKIRDLLTQEFKNASEDPYEIEGLQ